jgi:PAS domain S-box-containing protein
MRNTVYRIIFVVISLIIVFAADIFFLQKRESQQLKVLQGNAIKRAEILLQKNLELLSQNQISYTYDYTYWDDMVRFVQKPDPIWAARNILSSINSYKLQCAWVLDKSFNVVYLYNTIDSTRSINFPLDNSVLREIFVKEKFPHFYLKTESDLIEIVGAPIQFSNDLMRIGIPQGYYFTGRIWQKTYLDEIGKINNSKVFTASAEESDKFEKELKSSNQPEEILAKTPLIGYDGSTILFLITQYADQGIKGMLGANQRQLQMFFIIGGVFIIALSLTLIFWIAIPIKTLTLGLVTGKNRKLEKLANRKTELGSLAKLAVDFYKQKDSLEQEVIARKKSESELIQIKNELEKRVKQRTNEIESINFQLEFERDQAKKYFDSAASLICLIDKEGMVKRINKYGCNLLGYNETDILGKNWFIDFLPQDISKAFLQDHKKIMNSEKKPVESYISSIVNVKGEKRVLVFYNNYLKNLTGKINELIFSAQDITQQKNIENSLRLSENRYRTLVETQPDLICRWLPDTRVTFANTAYCKFFNKDVKELIGKYWHEIVPDPSRSEIIKLRKNNNPVTSIIEYEVETLSADGNKYWIQWSDIPIKNEHGVITEYQSIGKDITKRKEAEIKLTKLSSAVIQSPVSILITDINGTIEYINPKFTEVTGYSFEEVKNQNSKIIKSGEQGSEFYKDLWDTILSGKTWKGELHNKKKNGDLFWENEQIAPIYNDKGIITHFVAVKEDITEKKKIIRELINAKETAEQSSNLKDAFIANISHEIRTPLNGILGMTNLIKELFASNISKDDEIFFEGIDTSSKRIIRTIDMILNFSRLQIGEFKIEQRKINLVEICISLVKEYYSSAERKSLNLTFENNCGLAYIFADEYTIIQSISNLIDNAIKFTNAGFVKVILYYNHAKEIMIDISDTGIGIAEEYYETIFQPYQQVELGYNRSYEGIGLGLSLTRKLLQLNSAFISVKSKKGQGSTFSINFGSPLIIFEKEEKSSQIHSYSGNSQLNDNKVILLVEDDKINQFIIKNYLTSNYKVLTTESSDDILDILMNNKINVILMDISIKGSNNGLQMAKEIKKIPEFSDIIIIATTAHVSAKDRQNAIESKCDDFIPKPFTQKGLLEIIEKNIFRYSNIKD